jgi:hypothetical protein
MYEDDHLEADYEDRNGNPDVEDDWSDFDDIDDDWDGSLETDEEDDLADSMAQAVGATQNVGDLHNTDD